MGGGSGKRIPPPPLEASLDDSQQSTSLTQSKLKPTIIDQLINPRKRYQPVLFIYWKRYIYIYNSIFPICLFLLSSFPSYNHIEFQFTFTLSLKILMYSNKTEFLQIFTNNYYTPSNYTNVQTTIFIISISTLVFIYYFYWKVPTKNKTVSSDKPPLQTLKSSKLLYDKSKEYQPLKPIPVTDFQWDQIEPIKSYPFKNAEYKLTMGIRTLDPQDWLLIEPTYKSRIETKSKILNNNHPDYPSTKDLRSSTLFSTPEAILAIKEFYGIVMNYMCDKYPTCFKIQEDENLIYNLITNKKYPMPNSIDDVEFDSYQLQEFLAENIEEDFIILLKDPTRESEENGGNEYFFKAGVFAFAAGFNPIDRFNTPLSFIHHPIPGYESKLKISMNRFFNRLSPGQFVTRLNFSIQTHNKFYVDDSNKGYHNPKGGDVLELLKFEDLDFENQVHYRSERQVLTKLPKSGAIVFTIRTYLLPLAQIKSEGKEVCDRLIGAIKGFPKDIAHYKRSDEWGEAVIQYLSK